MNNINEFIKKISLPDSKNNISIISSMLHSSEAFYRSFSIPKRSGGYRLITSPYPSLQHVQKHILNNILDTITCFKHSYAFTKNKSAIDHAKFHLGCNELLMMDIENYFPSIKKNNIFESLINNNIELQTSLYIAELCTFDDYLPQGACTSPALSNIVFLPIDIRLNNLAKSLSLKYSRYADDLAFSGEKIPRNLTKTIEKILQHYDFNINHKKSKLKINGSKKIITGISISNNELKIPKKFKRELRAIIYEIEKNTDHIFMMPNFDPMIYEKTIGKLNYWLQIEPNNNYAIKKRMSLINNYKLLKYK